MYFVIEMTELFRSYLICIVKCSYPFGGVTSGWQECDVYETVSGWCLLL